MDEREEPDETPDVTEEMEAAELPDWDWYMCDPMIYDLDADEL